MTLAATSLRWISISSRYSIPRSCKTNREKFEPKERPKRESVLETGCFSEFGVTKNKQRKIHKNQCNPRIRGVFVNSPCFSRTNTPNSENTPFRELALASLSFGLPERLLNLWVFVSDRCRGVSVCRRHLSPNFIALSVSLRLSLRRSKKTKLNPLHRVWWKTPTKDVGWTRGRLSRLSSELQGHPRQTTSSGLDPLWTPPPRPDLDLVHIAIQLGAEIHLARSKPGQNQVTGLDGG